VKLKSISGVVYTVKDISITATFYESIGFRVGKQENNTVTVYVNWFWVEFHQDTAVVPATGGSSLYISVDGVDAAYEELKAKPITVDAPAPGTQGRREMVVTDPDGYKLVFFQK
jgi:catechol 2,3-dioxygenase-like lactoylglutathione lyase family enzyme